MKCVIIELIKMKLNLLLKILYKIMLQKVICKTYYINNITSVLAAHQREKMMKWADSFCSAWNTVKQEIATLGMLSYIDEYQLHYTITICSDCSSTS